MSYDSPLWHPCTQMKDYEQQLPLRVTHAEGSYLDLEDGRRILDTVSSWWCKSLGYGHPKLRDALVAQAHQLEHCMLGNATHEPIEQLSSALAQMMPPLNKVMYASDGSPAIEIAMKMSLHAHQILGQKRTRFAALSGAYHGETCGALSVSDSGKFREPYETMLMTDVVFIDNIPYVHSRQDPLWNDCSSHWLSIKAQLDLHSATLTAILIEPIVQGANHMKMYSKDLLRRLRSWCDEHGVHLIADEIMTGFGRTGKMLACEHADVIPDFLCLGKALTAGWLPMSAMLTKHSMYDLFYDNYAAGNNFLHSHTFAGNPLAASVALATIKIMREESLVARAAAWEPALLSTMQDIADQTGLLQNVRGIGMIVAADLINANHVERFGFEIYKKALQHDLLLRPLGNTIYWMLPLNVGQDTMHELKKRIMCVLMG